MTALASPFFPLKDGTPGPDGRARQALRRAERLNPALRAFVSLGSAAHGTGPLAGLPVAIKDCVESAGRAPSCGLARAPGATPEADAPILARLKETGAAITGFTALTALAYEPSGENPEQGRPLNPWHAERVCGGSSSGSAVAVAAGIVPVALGTDTGGSLRIPAQCCGVSAWKSSHGAIDDAGVMPLAPSLDTVGFLGRAASDLLAIHDALGLKPETNTIKRIGVARDLLAACDPDIQRAVSAMETALSDRGLITGDVALADLIAHCDGPVFTVMQSEAYATNRALIESGRLDPVLEGRLSKGSNLTNPQVRAARVALAGRAAFALETIFAGCDAVLLPVMRIRTPRIAECQPASPGFSPRTLYALSALTRWVNGLGFPAVALPAEADRDGLPIALQLVARPGWDRALLQCAAHIQNGTDWHRRLPSAMPGLSGEDP
jgi:aspartyl-tRNA(Asn)/glutamyl-tRNA(Gln) amidotransferase subunit A